MKQISTSGRGILLLMLVVLMSRCRDEEERLTPQDPIKKTWVLDATGFVKQDGQDVSSEYPGLAITFNANDTYTAANAKKLFFPSGTWSWQGAETTTVLLDGDFVITVKEITATKLHVEFQMNAEDVNPNGRTSAVVGSYEVSLIGS